VRYDHDTDANVVKQKMKVHFYPVGILLTGRQDDGGCDDLACKDIVANPVDSLTNSKLFSTNGLDLFEGGLEVVKDVAANVIDIQKK
jgi:hypothetical protein